MLRKVNEDKYEFSGTFPVYDVFIHELACLVVQVELSMKIPLENSIEESMKVVLGWKPVFVDQDMVGKNKEMVRELNLGPGKSLNLETLFELPGKTRETKATLCFDVNLTSTMNKAPVSRDTGVKFTNAGAPTGENAEATQLRAKLSQTRTEFEKLKQQNEQLVRLASTSKERQRNASPDSVPQYLPQQMTTTQIVSPDFEKHYLNKLEKLQETINDVKRAQQSGVLPPIAYGAQSLQGSNYYGQKPPPPPNYHLYADPREDPRFGGYQDPRRPVSQDPSQPLPKADYDARIRDSYERSGRPTAEPPRYSDKLGRVEQASYIEAGIKGLIDPYHSQPDPALSGVSLKTELEDPKKISTFTLQLLGIKYLPPNNDITRFNYRIPSRLFMTFDFFTYPTFRTKKLSYLDQNLDELRNQPANCLGKLLLLYNEDYVQGGSSMKEPMYAFEVNPLNEGTTSVHDLFVHYLASKELVVDVWDGDSLMHFAKFRFRLHQLLRQGKDSEMKTLTLEMFDEATKECRGTVQLVAKNHAIFMENRPDRCPPEVSSFYFNRSNKGGKVKVKSLKPMDLEKELKPVHGDRRILESDLQDEEHRKKLRIDRFKIMRSQNPYTSSVGPKNSQDLQVMTQSLREVEAIREKKKAEAISNALATGFSEQHHICALFGHSKYLTYKFENLLPQRSDFRVKIEYGRGMIVQEFNLVKNPKEWEKVCLLKKVERPPEWGMLETTDVFTLDGSESITLILKFLSYDEDSLKAGKQHDKIATLSILDIKGQVICGISFNFRLLHPIVEKTLKFNELESRMCSIDLPPFYQSPAVDSTKYSPLTRPHVEFTNPAAKLEWLNENQARIKIQSASAPQSLIFFMMVYENIHRIALLSMVRVVISSQTG